MIELIGLLILFAIFVFFIIFTSTFVVPQWESAAIIRFGEIIEA